MEQLTPMLEQAQPPPPASGRAVPAIAVAAATLWQRALAFDPADPGWADRDRFVLSSGRFAPLLHWLLDEAGVAPPAPNARFGEHPALETEAGPPGQGFATAVGLAMAERVLAARFGRTLVDHRTWVLACETDLAAGVALEAAEMAGRQELGKLAVLFEPQASGQANGQAAGSDAATRFAAAGWAVRQVDGGDADAVAAAIARAQRNRKPTLIACLENGTAVDADWATPATWRTATQRGAVARRGWLKRLARHRMGPEFERQISGRLPPHWHRAMLAGAPVAEAETLAAARQDLLALGNALPESVMLQSAAGLAISALPPSPPRQPDDDPGATTDIPPAPARGTVPPVATRPPPAARQTGTRHLFCGVQEHGMAALGNGLSLHGGLRPILAASVVSIDRMRPALRLAALMEQPVVYLLSDRTPDNTGWPPMEQFASLRAMPHVALFRPADPVELAACWSLALAHADGPSLLALSGQGGIDQAVNSLRTGSAGPSWRHDGCAQGGYVLAEAGTRRRATLIATGPEVVTALRARTLLARRGVETAVVSLPCWELFARRPAAYHAQVLGQAPRIGIEAASGFGWERWLGPDGVFIGMDGFETGRHSRRAADRFGPWYAEPDGRDAGGTVPPGDPGGITADFISTRVLGLLGLRTDDNLNEE